MYLYVWNNLQVATTHFKSVVYCPLIYHAQLYEGLQSTSLSGIAKVAHLKLEKLALNTFTHQFACQKKKKFMKFFTFPASEGHQNTCDFRSSTERMKMILGPDQAASVANTSS